MNARITRETDFSGMLASAFQGSKNPKIVAGNIDGHDPKELLPEFLDAQQLRPEIEKPAWHTSLSLESDERLNSAQWSIVAVHYTERMGLDQLHPWIAVRHCDTARDHIHIIASCIAYDGTLFLGRFELLRAIRLAHMFERQYGLETTQQLTVGRLGKKGDVQCGTMNGFSFELKGITIKGSGLGDQYKWASLQNRVSYDQAIDYAGLVLYRGTTGATPNPGTTQDPPRLGHAQSHTYAPPMA